MNNLQSDTKINPKIQLDQKDLITVNEILSEHLKSGSKVFAFGSRVKGSSKKYSDLDLLVYASGDEIFKLRVAFEESSLGFNVDVVDGSKVSDVFFAEISPQLIPIFY